MSNARDKANIPALNFSSTGIDDNATSTAITIDSSQRVGIGGNPSSALDVRNTNPIIQTVDLDNNATSRFDGNAGWIALRADNANVASGTNITFNIDGTEKMRIDSSGNVGIGTSNPSAKLDIIETVASTTSSIWTGETLALKDDTAYAQGVGGALIFEGKYNSSGGYSTFGYIRGSKSDASDGGFQGGIVYGTRGGNHIFVTNASGLTNGTDERMRINSSGNVGIGTSSPSNKLHVKGTWVTNEGIMQIDANSGTQYSGLTLQNNGTARTYFYHDNTNNLTFLGSTTGEHLVFATNSITERMRITSSGYVGINKTSPSEQLDVLGAVQATVFTTLRTQKVMNVSSADWDISSVVGTVPNVEGSISFELTMRERSSTGNQLFRIFYIRVGPGTTFDISPAIWSVGSSAATTTISYPSAGIIRFTNSSFSVLDALIRRISV